MSFGCGETMWKGYSVFFGDPNHSSGSTHIGCPGHSLYPKLSIFSENISIFPDTVCSLFCSGLSLKSTNGLAANSLPTVGSLTQFLSLS